MNTVGIALPPNLPTRDVVPFIQRADALGFDQLWAIEDCFLRGGIAQAAVALASTRRIHIGIGILPAAARNVAFAAMDVATLADLYPGRLSVGVGHGMPSWMRQVGAWPESPVTLLREYSAALRDLLRGHEARTDGNRYIHLHGCALDIPPVRPPTIYCGVRGPKSLSAIADVADGVLLAEPVTPEYLADVRASLDGGRAAQQIAAYHLAAVDRDPRIAIAAVRASLERVGDPEWRAHLSPLPFAGELVELRNASTSGAAFAQAMPQRWIRQLSITGSPSEARQRLAELYAAGCTTNILVPVQGMEALPALAELVSA